LISSTAASEIEQLQPEWSVQIARRCIRLGGAETVFIAATVA
jgi:hypothetical protein